MTRIAGIAKALCSTGIHIVETGLMNSLPRGFRWMRHGMYLLVLILTLCAGAVQAEQRTAIQVIELQHRTAEDVIPLLAPLLGSGEVVTGTGMRLILRSSPATLAEVRQVLDRLDAAPATLLVSVRRGSTGGSLERGVQVQGRVGGVIIGDGSDTRVIRRETTERDGSTQTLRVLEGQAALIRTGESVPVVSHGPLLWPGGGLTAPGIDYRDLERGFLVRPRVVGDDRVQLEIRQVHEREARGGAGRIEFQQVDTVLSGELGEWIRVGGVERQRDHSEQRILGTRRERHDDQVDVYVRVDRVE
jgi:hypothetical protein